MATISRDDGIRAGTPSPRSDSAPPPDAPEGAADRRDGARLAEELGDLIRVVQFRDRDRACCYDLSVSQCYALEAVVRAGPMTVNDLAGRLYLDKSTASRIAQGLVDKALVARRRDPTDGRVVRLEATDAGVELYARISDDLARQYGELMADLSPDVRAAVTRVVGRLARSFAAGVEVSAGSCCVVK